MAFKRGKSRDGDVARKTYSWPLEYKGENVMYKLPTNIQWNDNIIVNEDEYAVFFRDGKAFHAFDQAGRYALTTQLFQRLGAFVTGVRQLGEVYYVQRRELRGKFGTPEPLTYRDTDFGLVRLRTGSVNETSHQLRVVVNETLLAQVIERLNGHRKDDLEMPSGDGLHDLLHAALGKGIGDQHGT